MLECFLQKLCQGKRNVVSKTEQFGAAASVIFITQSEIHFILGIYGPKAMGA